MSNYYCTLAGIKSRLGITGTGDDTLIEGMIAAASNVFDRHCNRKFARSDLAEQFFQADQKEISLDRYPVEMIASIQLREHARSAWVRQIVDYELINSCVLRLAYTLGDESQQCRVMYAGGYVLPSTTALTGQTALPDEVVQAAQDQVCFWYERRHTLRFGNVDAQAPTRRPETLELTPHVREMLRPFVRMAL